MPKVVDHDEKRDKIAAVACQTIARLGVAASSMRMIAKAANCTTGTLTHYFPDKNALLTAAIKYAIEKQLSELQEVASEEPGNLLKIFTVLLPLTPHSELTAKIFLTFWNRSANTPQINRLQRTWHQRYIRLCASIFLNAGLTNDDKENDAGLAGERLIIFINGINVRALLEPDLWSADRQVKELAWFLEQRQYLRA